MHQPGALPSPANHKLEHLSGRGPTRETQLGGTQRCSALTARGFKPHLHILTMFNLFFVQTTMYLGHSLNQKTPIIYFLYAIIPLSCNTSVGADPLAPRARSHLAAPGGFQAELCRSPGASSELLVCLQGLERGEGPHRRLPGALPRVGHPPPVLALQLQLLV